MRLGRFSKGMLRSQVLSVLSVEGIGALECEYLLDLNFSRVNRCKQTIYPSLFCGGFCLQ